MAGSHRNGSSGRNTYGELRQLRFNGYATDLLGKTSTRSEQANLARVILRQPAVDPGRSNHVWEKHVLVHKDAYEMNP